jgi:hypothetical protein
VYVCVKQLKEEKEKQAKLAAEKEELARQQEKDKVCVCVYAPLELSFQPYAYTCSPHACM